ncbi:DUF58 domain-containing protein [Paenibacillus sp. N4]|uniref:DUF58 domain-containing protein n=1 Tax=Paenibacillus vietnamensis TaxID=2590547 RepID=UPI001CD0F9BA|nr:DUF58 domain-containing protein [Paenibacillus vietnamensis]MCA0758643.1 DUF58 domain-containing protein [Paenibacillus vietnamensis]
MSVYGQEETRLQDVAAESQGAAAAVMPGARAEGLTGKGRSGVQVKPRSGEDKERESERKYRTRWAAWTVIIAGWICSLGAVVVRGGAVEWFLAALLAGIIAVSGLAPLIAAAGLTATRVMPQEDTNDGERLEIRYTIRRPFAVPLVWIALQDETRNLTAASAPVIPFRAVWAAALRKEIGVTYKLHHLRRGDHICGPTTVTVGDWLGLTAIRKSIDSQAGFIVLPGLRGTAAPEAIEHGAGVEPVSSSQAGPAADLRGEAGREEIASAVRAAGIGPESRPYREGDSLRHLDWRTAAKGRGLHTKLHTPELPYPAFIAVDSSAAAYGQDDRLFDACAGWAAHAVLQAASLGGRVTLLTGDEMTGMPDGIRESMRERTSDLLRKLAVLQADGKGSLAGSLMKSGYALARGGTVLVFTADWRGGRNWGELAGYAAERGCRLELFIVVRSTVPTFAMSEQRKWLEAGGVKVTWLHVPAGMGDAPYAEEGGDAHAYA